MIRIFLLSFLLAFARAGCGIQSKCPSDKTEFPKDFLIGVATSAYQIEGAWKQDGKRESIWDNYTHAVPSKIRDGSNGDIACDNYNKYEEDIKTMYEMGINVHRFSLPMTRLVKSFRPFVKNNIGIQHYHKIIDLCHKYNMTPMVTLYHWDLSQELQDLGGWESPEIVTHFVKYADLCFKEYGPKVKWFSTFNEFWSFCFLGHGANQLAPGNGRSGISEYLCGHHALLAHGAAYRLYNIKYRAAQKGQVGIVLNTGHYLPMTNSKEDIQAAEDANSFFVKWFAEPVITGDYPSVMKKNIAYFSKQEGLNSSRLPTFTKAESLMLRDSTDYFGVNFYTTSLTTAGLAVPHQPSWFFDSNTTSVSNMSEPVSPASNWLRISPDGLGVFLKYMNNYKKPLFITENGYSDLGGLNDITRVEYFKAHLEVARKALCEDNVNLIGYTAWSLLDNMEWSDGYEPAFGLIDVDQSDPNRKRTLKKSAKWYRKFAKTKRIPKSDDPELEL